MSAYSEEPTLTLRAAPSVFFALAVLLAPTLRPSDAAAQPAGDLLALHPCVVTGEKDKGKVQEYEKLCASTLAREDEKTVPEEQLHAFLDKEPKKSCALARQPAECLGRLATTTQAAHALLVTLSPGALTRATGLVVSAQGEVVDQKSIQLRNRGQPQEELLRTALQRLRAQLNIHAPRSMPISVTPPPPPPPDLTPPATPPPAVAATPGSKPEHSASPATPTQVSFFAGRTWKTPVAYASAGVGLAALATAGFLALDGDRAMRDSNAYYAGGRYPTANDVPRIVELRETASSRRTIAGVSAAVGAALAGAGVYLWLNDRPRPSSPKVAALSVSPSGVSLVGILP